MESVSDISLSFLGLLTIGETSEDAVFLGVLISMSLRRWKISFELLYQVFIGIGIQLTYFLALFQI